MMPARWLTLAAISILAACAGCATPTAKTAPEAVKTSAEPPGPGFLVYYAHDDGFETAWLEVDGDDYEVVARSEGAYATSDGELWSWTTFDKEHQLTDCECVMEQYNKGAGSDEDLAQCQTTGTTEVPALRRESSGDTLPLAEVSDMEQTGDFSVQATNHGAVGPYWFGTVCTYIYGCGAAHGSSNCRSVVADLDRGEVTELTEFLSEDAVADVNERLRDRAADALGEKTPDNTQITEAESAQLEAGWPVLTRDGLAFSYLFAAPTCYACSDGSWSSYSVGVEVRDDALPDRLESLAKPPAAVLAFVESQDIFDTTLGWTALPEDGTRRAAFLKQFRTTASTRNGDTHD